MQKIEYKNALGESVALSQTFPYLLQNLDGISAPPATMLTGRGFQQDGISYYGSLLEPRTINLRAVIYDKNRQGLLDKRAEIMRVFNPRLREGILFYENDVNKYRIDAVVFDGPHEIIDTSSRTAAMQCFDIGFYCPKPAWESVVEDSRKLEGFVGGMTFPYTLPFSLATQGDQIMISYPGTLDAPLLIEFRGPATKPKIMKNETGEYIEIDVELLADERLFINTTPAEIDVYVEDESGSRQSAFNYIDPLSSYFMLTQGLNTISFSASSGEPEVYIKHRTQYVSI